MSSINFKDTAYLSVNSIGHLDEEMGKISFSMYDSFPDSPLMNVGGRYGVYINGGERNVIINGYSGIECRVDNGKFLYNDSEVATQQWVLDQGYGSGGGSITIPATIQVNEIIAKDDSDIGSINFTSSNGISIGGRFGVVITDGEMGRSIHLNASNGNNIICSTTDDGKLLYNNEEVATKNWVQNNGYGVDLSKYYTKTEIDAKSYISFINNTISKTSSFSIYAGYDTNGMNKGPATLDIASTQNIRLSASEYVEIQTGKLAFWEGGEIRAGYGYGMGRLTLSAPEDIHLNSDGPGNVYVNNSRVVTENRFAELLTTIAKPITVSYDTYYIPGQTWRQWAQTTFCTILCGGDVHIGPGSDGNEYICYQGVPYAEDEEHLADSFIVG